MAQNKIEALLVELTKRLQKPRALAFTLDTPEPRLTICLHTLVAMGVCVAVGSGENAGRPAMAYGLAGWDYSKSPPTPPTSAAADKVFADICSKIPGLALSQEG